MGLVSWLEVCLLSEHVSTTTHQVQQTSRILIHPLDSYIKLFTDDWFSYPSTIRAPFNSRTIFLPSSPCSNRTSPIPWGYWFKDDLYLHIPKAISIQLTHVKGTITLAYFLFVIVKIFTRSFWSVMKSPNPLIITFGCGSNEMMVYSLTFCCYCDLCCYL